MATGIDKVSGVLCGNTSGGMTRHSYDSPRPFRVAGFQPDCTRYPQAQPLPLLKAIFVFSAQRLPLRLAPEPHPYEGKTLDPATRSARGRTVQHACRIDRTPPLSAS